MVAAASAPVTTVQLLATYCAEVGNALPCAARSDVAGRLEVVRFLLDNGAPIDAVQYQHNAYGFGSDFDMGPALTLAVCYNSDDMVELLLERGCRTDIVDFEGRNALQLAREFGSAKKVELLERHFQLERATGGLGERGKERTYWQAGLVDRPGEERVELKPFVRKK